jgi:hypothetical protein
MAAAEEAVMLMIKDKKLSDIQQAGAGLKQPCAQ